VEACQSEVLIALLTDVFERRRQHANVGDGLKNLAFCIVFSMMLTTVIDRS